MRDDASHTVQAKNIQLNYLIWNSGSAVQCTINIHTMYVYAHNHVHSHAVRTSTNWQWTLSFFLVEQLVALVHDAFEITIQYNVKMPTCTFYTCTCTAVDQPVYKKETLVLHIHPSTASDKLNRSYSCKTERKLGWILHSAG